jgi:hypothetical protein
MPTKTIKVTYCRHRNSRRTELAMPRCADKCDSDRQETLAEEDRTELKPILAKYL